MTSLVKIGENYFERDTAAGKYPIFSYELNRRVKHKEACIVVVVGEAGSGKSYLAIQLARNIDPRVSIDQIVFTYSDFVKELGRLDHAGIPIVFDEPSYAMGKREWYKQINQALVKVIESSRFLVRPLIIPIININLLDKTLRDFLVIFQVHITKRGSALVYRMRASQGEDKVYRYMVCRLNYPMVDFEQCHKDTCLGRNDCLDTCELLRARYERKKKATQLARYEQDEEQAKQRESKEITMDQFCSMIKPYASLYTFDGKIDALKLRYVFHEKLGIQIGRNKSYEIKTVLEMREKIIETPIS